jgi:hypothetical protein
MYMGLREEFQKEAIKAKELNNAIKAIKKLGGGTNWELIIQRERPFVDIRPYSHNIISTALRAISQEQGIKKANKAITKYKLKELGWNYERINEPKKKQSK